MGREVRRVPENWEHPRNEKGDYIPLFYRSFAEDDERWVPSAVCDGGVLKSGVEFEGDQDG